MVGYPCPPCCVHGTTKRCLFGGIHVLCKRPPDKWNADLGAGGWTDLRCPDCDEIGGSYELSYLGMDPMGICAGDGITGAPESEGPPRCCWTYMDWDWCGEDPPGGNVYRTQLTLRFFSTNSSGNWRPWRYRFTVNSAGVGGWAMASFQSTPTTSRDCRALIGSSGKITLTKHYEQHTASYGSTGPPCGGQLPQTITIAPTTST